MPLLTQDGDALPAHVLKRAHRRTDAAEARRDAASSPLLSSPSPYQQQLQAECAHLVHDDLDLRLEQLAILREAQASCKSEHAELSQMLEPPSDSAEPAEALNAINRPHWTGRINEPTKWAILGALGLFEYVLVRTALDLLFLDDWVKALTALIVGVVPIVVIELSGGQLTELFHWHGEKIERRRRWQFAAALLLALATVITAFVVLMGFIRVDGFVAARVFDDIPHRYAVMLGVGLAVLQAAALMAAVALTRQHAAGDRWRAEARVRERLSKFANEKVALRERIRGMRVLAEEAHLAILSYYRARDARYRAVLARALPASEAQFGTAWPQWEKTFIEALASSYDHLKAEDEEDDDKDEEDGATEDGASGDGAASMRKVAEDVEPDDVPATEAHSERAESSAAPAHQADPAE